MTSHLVFPVLAPLGAAILCLALYRSVRAQRLVSLAAGASLVAYVFAGLWPLLRQHGIVTLQIGNWPAPYGITLAADLFSGVMLSLATIVGLAVLVYAVGWFGKGEEALFFYPLYHILLMGVNGSFLTGDVFNLYVFFEVMLTSSFGLLALGGQRAQIEGAIKYVAISQISSALFLLGAGLLYGIAGTLNMAELAQRLAAPQAAPYASIVSLLFLVAFGIKAAIFPLFFWLPASYHTAKTPVSAIFGGLLAEVGVYALYRFYTLLFPAQWLAQRELLLGIAGLTMVVGVLGALAQNDVKRLLSFDIISQVGYLIAGLALATPLALAGAIYFMIHIVLVKTSLFLVAGLMEQEAGTVDLRRLGGLLRRRPGLAGLFLVPALSLAGLPPLSGFFAKLSLVLAGIERQQFGLVAAALGVSLLTLTVMIRVWAQGFMREAPPDSMERSRPQPALMAATAGLITAIVLAAVLAAPLFQVAQQAAQQLAGSAPYLAAVLGR